jgi:hypothetical protein
LNVRADAYPPRFGAALDGLTARRSTPARSANQELTFGLSNALGWPSDRRCLNLTIFG